MARITNCNSSLPIHRAGMSVVLVGDEEQLNQNHPTTEMEMGDSSNNIQMTGQTASHVGDEEEQASNPPPATSYNINYSGPEGVANLLRFYPFVMGPIIGVWKLTLEKPALNPLTIMSLVAYLAALLIHIIMACMYDLLLNPPGRLLDYLHHYMILKYSFYAMCILAYFSLLPILFILYYHQK